MASYSPSTSSYDYVHRFGSLFCPFLPAIGFMRNILVFYLRTVAVFIFDSPPQAFFRVASTHNFYMAILLVTVFISLLPVGFAMIEMVPSLRCGPFRLAIIYHNRSVAPKK